MLVGFGGIVQLDAHIQSIVLIRKSPGSTHRASLTLDRWVIWPLKKGSSARDERPARRGIEELERISDEAESRGGHLRQRRPSAQAKFGMLRERRDSSVGSLKLQLK